MFGPILRADRARIPQQANQPARTGMLAVSQVRNSEERPILRKRFYILFVARDPEGELRKIPIPLHHVYVFMAGALLGMLTITGMAGSYVRMLTKVTRFNQLRSEKEALKSRYTELEEASKEKDIQVASLGSIASEVSAIYGLKAEPLLVATSDSDDQEQVQTSLDQLDTLRRSALTGVANIGVGLGLKQADGCCSNALAGGRSDYRQLR
jgi:hypothetical protein